MQVLGVDIGGSGVKGALVHVADGTLVGERHRIATPRPATPGAVADTVAAIAGHFSWQGPIGCGVPAVVQQGVVATAANIATEWIGADASALFSARTGCPVVTINDADAAGVAEMRLGAGRGRGGVVFVLTLGTGIGTALFVDGRLVPNLELGHLEVDGLEGERRASAAARKRDDLTWPQWAARVDRYLGELQRLFWPDLFILGGGVSRKAHKFLPLLTCAVPVVPAQLQNQAGIVGAAMVAADAGRT